MTPNNAFALTACALFGAGLAHGALIAYYPFDEGAGTTTANAQGNAALDGVLRPDAGWAAGHTGIALDLTGVATSAVDVTGDWTIGMDDCCGNVRNFDGQLDDLAIFDHALSPEEHALLFSGAANPLTIPEPSVPSLCVLLGLASLARRRR